MSLSDGGEEEGGMEMNRFLPRPPGTTNEHKVPYQPQRSVSPVPSYLSMKSDFSMDPPLNFNKEPKVPYQPQRSVSPVPSGLSMKSDFSMDPPLNFNKEPKVPYQPQRSVSPVPSGLSMKSDFSMDPPLNFNKEPKVPYQPQRSVSPVPSGLSMKSDFSMDPPLNFNKEPKVPYQPQRSVSPVPSGLSMKSDFSMDPPLNFHKEPKVPYQPQRSVSPVPSGLSMKSDFSMDPPLNFRTKPNSLKRPASPQSGCAVCEQQPRDPVSAACGHRFCRDCLAGDGQPGPSAGVVCPRCKKRARMQPAALRRLETPDGGDSRRPFEDNRAKLKRRFERLIEGVVQADSETLLSSVYTELYITEGESEGVNSEHEVWQLEAAYRVQTPADTPIDCNDIFNRLPGQVGGTAIRTVLSVGVAGIGKTVAVHKFILDWADGEANHQVDVVCVLPFRELNLIRGAPYSLLGLLRVFHPELRADRAEQLVGCKILFIFDGLDESKLALDFRHGKTVTDVARVASVDAVLTSLIAGKLLPSALVWITSRPAASHQIPARCVDRVTEVRGFNDQQKEAYFRKRFRDDEKLAGRVVSHLRTSKSLHIMCHMPVFCWITATVLQQMLVTDDGEEMPKTLTEMYSYFLLVQMKLKNHKYPSEKTSDRQAFHKEVLLKLGKLAFDHLEKGNLMFYREDLEDCGLEVQDAAVFSGVCTEIFKEESVIFQKMVYCFVHLSIQEFLSAVYVYHCYSTRNLDALKTLARRKSKGATELLLHELLKNAAETALESKNGHLDLFVRFLHGLSLESNQRLLGSLLPRTVRESPESKKQIIRSLRVIQKKNLSPERCINLFHCLIEMNDHSIKTEIQEYLGNERKSRSLTLLHCSALAYMLQLSEEVMDELQLKTYKTSDEGRRRLVPAVRCCRRAELSGCKLTQTSCEVVSSALSSNPSHLTHLDLSHNDVQDPGVKLLSAGLGSPNCRLETLRLAGCNLTQTSCELVASALVSNPLKELDLSENDVLDAGVKLFCAGLEDPHCKLERLRLRCCLVTEAGCASLASALSSNPSSLRELDLSNNDLQDSGVKLLCSGLSSTHCHLEILRLSHCMVTEEGCAALASALTSNPSHLRELHLRYNHPGESGVKLLSACLEDPAWRLETLVVDQCGPSWIDPDPGCKRYACALTLDPHTAGRHLLLSEGDRRMERVRQAQPYPDHPERFDHYSQIMCRQALTTRCYWQVTWSGVVNLGVTYKGIGRKGRGDYCLLGANATSWRLYCDADKYAVWHDKRDGVVSVRPSGAQTVAVYLDWAGGTLSFYRVSSGRLTHLHTFHHAFTEPLYPAFRVSRWNDSSVLLS